MTPATDDDVIAAFAVLFRDLGGDPDHMPNDSPLMLYRAFRRLGAPADVLSLVGSWHDTLTNREVIQVIATRRSRAVEH